MLQGLKPSLRSGSSSMSMTLDSRDALRDTWLAVLLASGFDPDNLHGWHRSSQTA